MFLLNQFLKTPSKNSDTFNTNGIVYDNTPWRPGKVIDVNQSSEEDERKLKNLATRILSNGVEVLVKDKSHDGKQEQRMLKLKHITSSKPHHVGTTQNKSLLSSAVATVVSQQQKNAFFPMHQLMQHNYIIKTCMTTYTYLTTIVQNKRSAISTFETIVSVVTTESLTNLYATDVLAELKPTKTKYMEVKTIQPTAANNMYLSNLPKIDKRIDHDDDGMFDLIQPSEINHVSCTTTSCSCSHTKTEGLQSKYTNIKETAASSESHGTKTTKRDAPKVDIKTTNKETMAMKTKYRPYDYEVNSQITPTDRIVEKYTEVISDYSDEKDSNSLEASDLLTNEQAPGPMKTNKVSSNKTSEKVRPNKPTKVNKNKLVVAELIKLGSLGIKGLSQLAPVFEKMTGSFMKRQEVAQNTTTTTEKPVTKLTPYTADKRVDSEETKQGNFPIYIPVDEMETAESQVSFNNISIHKNFPWAFDHKHSKGHYIVPPKIVQESPLVNGGIPISPGEIIRANSDVIVGKPAVGGPLTLAASGIKFHNPVNRPSLDSFMADSEQYPVNEQYPLSLPQNKNNAGANVDDSFDLRPPEPPKIYSKPLKSVLRPSSVPSYSHQNAPGKVTKDRLALSNKINSEVHKDHGRPAFLDYIPSLVKPTSTNIPIEHHIEFRPVNENKDGYEVMDSSPSSSEIISSKIETTDEDISDSSDSMNKPFLVDIQPSRVANVLIPHGSSTALVFAGSSEPHKTGDYIDDPLPYPEPGYFGSFSIDAPQMTNVHSVSPNKGQLLKKPNIISHSVDHQSDNRNIQFNEKEIETSNNIRLKWENNQHLNSKNIPPPISIQESHVRIGPQITVYKPENYNGDFEKYKQNKKPPKSKDGKEIIDRDYENYLAVPPPPPKSQYQDSHYSKNKPYNQRPIVHTKPVQDMKVFLNVQHPIPDQLPPKITSEIYFASQPPKNIQSPSYSAHIPKISSANEVHFSKHGIIHQPYKPNNFESNSFSIISSPNISNKSIVTNINEDNTYSVTLNTVTGIKNEGHTIGSSISVPISTSEHNGELNANIPIGTNFAIRVEDDPSKYDTVALHGKRDPSLIMYDKTLHNNLNKVYPTISSNAQNITKKNNFVNDLKNIHEPVPPSLNSHANFPMINDKIYISNKNEKPVSEILDDMESNEQRRPGKIISNIPTNSHGWYSSIFKEDNLKYINNIKVEPTTRKVIPLTYEFDKGRVPDFGPKISTVGKPPTEFLEASAKPSANKFNIGRPFSKQKDADKPVASTFTIKPSYIPSIYVSKQPVYNIPIVDNSEEVTTKKTLPENLKPVYETSEEIYDGKEGLDESDEEISGEVSSESMKVPIVTLSNENKNKSKSTNEIMQSTQNDKVELVKFNPGTQTEKPFRTVNKTTFHSNNMNPIFNNNPYMKPRPFTANNAIPLDHQMQQPHWQINQMMENGTNASYEDSLELNTGEKLNEKLSNNTIKSFNESYTHIQFPYKHKVDFNNTSALQNDSNIITSIIHIKDKKPLLIKVPDKSSTLPSFTINTDDVNNETFGEIIDLSPPPPRSDYNIRPLQNNELIMGMSPPPPGTGSINRHPTKAPQTARPILPVRTPPPYRNVPPRTLPPRLHAQRPVKKPSIMIDEVSTYRPAHDVFNKIKRPYFNRDQPSSLLLPPPRELPTVVPKLDSVSASTLVAAPSVSNVIFPTPTSSGWITSSGVEFSSSFKFTPTSVKYPEIITSSKIDTDLISSDTSAENSYSYEDVSSQSKYESSEKPVTEKKYPSAQSFQDESTAQSSEFNNNSDIGKPTSYESSQEDNTTDKIKVTSIMSTRNRTRKPYPVRGDDRKTNKYKSPTKSSTSIAPTRTVSRPEILYPTRQVSIKKVVRPGLNRYPSNQQLHIIESSEIPLEDDFIKPTQTLNIYDDMSTVSPEVTSVIEKTVTSTLTINKNPESINTPVLHHAGNEIKISDIVIPTKTEFKTTVVTLTKTLSEPPQTISSIGYVNLTHTLTVTHTKTSLVSQSEGAVTQTFVLTNTHTSTVVDVITEIYTQVQPTTIIETVTKHIPIPQVEATPVQDMTSTKVPLDDISMSSEEKENFIIKDSDETENIQKIETEEDKDTDSFFVVMNKSQNGAKSPPINADIETGDYDGITRNEQVNSNGVSQVLFGEILLAGTPYLETTNIGHSGIVFGKECQPDCKASRNERCQRIDGMMKCVCRPGFARMFPDRPCKPTYTYSVSLVLASQGNKRLKFHPHLADNSTKEYHNLAIATHEGINRMVMQSDLRDVFHGVHITGFHPVEMTAKNGEVYQGVINDFYVQLSDNAHEYRLKEVIEKYLRNNNYSLGGTEVHAAADLIDRLIVSDFDECLSSQFHDCSEHAKCFNLRGTYTCSCLEGFADLSVNTLYPGRICSSEAVGCDTCNYHGTCFDRESAVICECFKWYAGKTCQINLKAVLITVTVSGLLIIAVVTIYASRRCCARRSPDTQTFVIGCMQGMPSLHQGNMPKQRADRRALIAERETAETCSVQNASLPYIPTKRSRASTSNKCGISEPPSHSPPPPPPAPALLIPRARLHHHSDSRDNLSRKKSLEACAEAKLISYLESGAANVTEEMRRKHSLESSYSANKEKHNKQGALVSAGFKVSTTVRPEDGMKEDDASSINKTDIDGQLSRFDTLRKSYSQEDNMSEWTDAERRLGELTMSEARSVGGTLPASTGRAASSTRLTHQEANTMAERDLGSTFLLPHVHLYKPDPTSDVSEFDSL